MTIPHFEGAHILTNLKLYCLATAIGLAAFLGASGQVTSSEQVVRSKESANQNKSPDKIASKTVQQPNGIKVVFEENTPGVIIVESNGERIRVDTTRKTIETLAMISNGEHPALSDRPQTADAPTKQNDDEESAYDFDKGDEPYDFRVVNVPDS